MATCKDCVHYEACSFKLPFYQVEKLMPCARFKDKSQYAEVKHGEWIDSGECDWRCTNCNEYFTLDIDMHPIDDCGIYYCPNCGAKMDGGKDGQEPN